MKPLRLFQWTCLAVVKPCIIAALIINGIPPTIRAVSSGIVSVINAINKTAKQTHATKPIHHQPY